MSIQFRRSKKVGPFRITASNNGIGVSAGAGPVRVSRSPKGRVTRTVRAPGTGLYDVKVMNSGGSNRRPMGEPSVIGGAAGGSSVAGVSGDGSRGGGQRKGNGKAGCLWIIVGFFILGLIGKACGSDNQPTTPAPLISSTSSTTTEPSPTSTSETMTPETSTSSSETPYSSTSSEHSSESSTAYASPSETYTETQAPLPAATATTAPTSAGVVGGGAACFPKTNRGNCYKPGEFCRKSDIGVSGIGEGGVPITCRKEGKRPKWY